MMYRLPFDRVLLAVLLVGVLWTPSAIAFDSKTPRWHFEFDVNSGFGLFASLRPPDLFDPGNLSGLIPTTQKGLPVVLSLTPSYGSSAFLWYTNISITQLNALDAPPEAADAQYNRWQVASGVSAKLVRILGRPSLSFEFGYRLVDYVNISAGHYVEAITPRLKIASQPVGNWRGELSFGLTTAGEFGYFDGKRRRPLEPSKVLGRTSNIRADYVLSRESSIFFAVDHESYQVDLANLVSYQDHGFSVLPQQRVALRYQLDTNIVQLGIRRLW